MFLENRRLEEELLFSLAAFLHLKKKSSEPRKRRPSNLHSSAPLQHEISRSQLPACFVLGEERWHRGRKPHAAGCERCGAGAG